MTTTWLDLNEHEEFGIDNLPYGVFSVDNDRRVGIRIGDQVLDLRGIAQSAPLDRRIWESGSLNALLELGRDAWTAVRAWVTELLTDPSHQTAVQPNLIPLDDVTMHLPIDVADYVDFYASEHHASNVGKLFRPGSDPLTPNWKHLPIGYHGRAGTIVVSGTPVIRPNGQRKPAGQDLPSFGPSARLDIEAELGLVLGGPTQIGEPVSVDEADDHLFGIVILNDWSARDIQAWEYVPLGPFLGRSFTTSISPWVVTLDALELPASTFPARKSPPC